MKHREILIFLGVAFGVSYAAWITALLLPEGRSTYLFASLSFFAMTGPLLGTVAVKRLGWKAASSVVLRPRRERLGAALQGVGVLYLVLWLTQFGLQNVLAQWRGTASITLTGETLIRFFIRTLYAPLLATLGLSGRVRLAVFSLSRGEKMGALGSHLGCWSHMGSVACARCVRAGQGQCRVDDCELPYLRAHPPPVLRLLL